MQNLVLVIGSGGREHALAWRLSRSATVKKVYVAPGNPGTQAEEKVENIAIRADESDALIAFCLSHQIDLVIVGPEQPLCDGIVDKMQAQGIKCFGPSAKAAQLEGSKVYSKQFLQKYNIPTANYASFTQVDAALSYLDQQSYPQVIKADGLAAGKGVIIAQTAQQAQETVKDMLAGNAFGEAGCKIVIEDFLVGEEASFIVLADGKNYLPMATSQDHKARDNGDTGPNTGGMGAYSPAPVVTDKIYQKVLQDIIEPTLKGMQEEGAEFVGFLYAGLMIDPKGNAKVLEFNVRFGDPETQPIMMRLQSNLDELCLAAIAGELANKDIKWNKKAALGVVLAAKGYPFSYAKGEEINGITTANALADTKVFHAGTKQENSKILSAGGRVLCVCALADTVQKAQKNAYQAVAKISWKSQYYRTDIGFKAL